MEIKENPVWPQLDQDVIAKRWKELYTMNNEERIRHLFGEWGVKTQPSTQRQRERMTMTDKIKIKDLPSFSMLGHLVDLDSIINYWTVLHEEPNSYEKESGLDTLYRAAYRFACGGAGEYILPIPDSLKIEGQVRRWLQIQKFNSVKKGGVGSIGNCYGSLEVFECDLKYYWTIDCPVYRASYQEIPKSLYDELVKFGEGA